jgi:hypothetical protein
VNDEWSKYEGQRHLNLIHDAVCKERDELKAELDEQCRLHGLGANREHKLITEIQSLKDIAESYRVRLVRANDILAQLDMNEQ